MEIRVERREEGAQKAEGHTVMIDEIGRAHV